MKMPCLLAVSVCAFNIGYALAQGSPQSLSELPPLQLGNIPGAATEKAAQLLCEHHDIVI